MKQWNHFRLSGRLQASELRRRFCLQRLSFQAKCPLTHLFLCHGVGAGSTALRPEKLPAESRDGNGSLPRTRNLISEKVFTRPSTRACLDMRQQSIFATDATAILF